MRYAVVGDIHGNLSAFQSVLDHLAHQGGCDELWCLGDIVGYGPEPHACIELLRSRPHLCVAGNHDWASIGEIDTTDFNAAAARACEWTAVQLTAEDARYLRELPTTLACGQFTLVHGSPRYPTWEYLLSVEDACASLGYFETMCCLVGHSHLPLAFVCGESGRCSRLVGLDGVVLGGSGARWIVNPGAVGQPRDGDPRASYALYDGETGVLRHYRVRYDIAATQRKMREQGLPPSLSQRLSYGY